MVLEIWKAISEGDKEYYFIIDTFNFSIYTRNFKAGIWFFDNEKEAKLELEKLEKEEIFGYWLGGE